MRLIPFYNLAGRCIAINPDMVCEITELSLGETLVLFISGNKTTVDKPFMETLELLSPLP